MTDNSYGEWSCYHESANSLGVAATAMRCSPSTVALYACHGAQERWRCSAISAAVRSVRMASGTGDQSNAREARRAVRFGPEKADAIPESHLVCLVPEGSVRESQGLKAVEQWWMP